MSQSSPGRAVPSSCSRKSDRRSRCSVCFLDTRRNAVVELTLLPAVITILYHRDSSLHASQTVRCTHLLFCCSCINAMWLSAWWSTAKDSISFGEGEVSKRTLSKKSASRAQGDRQKGKKEKKEKNKEKTRTKQGKHGKRRKNGKRKGREEKGREGVTRYAQYFRSCESPVSSFTINKQ